MPGNPDVAIRQQVYLRALYTLPRVSVHFGHFLVNTTRMAVANPPPGAPLTVEVVRRRRRVRTSTSRLFSWLTRSGTTLRRSSLLAITQTLRSR
jgi:hypothetical protein